MPPGPEAEDQKALELFTMRAGIVYVHLFDLWLIDLNLAFGEDHLLGVGLADVGSHLDVLAIATKIDLAFLCVGDVVDDLVVLRPGKVGLGCAEVRGGFVQAIEHLLQIGGLSAGAYRESNGAGCILQTAGPQLRSEAAHEIPFLLALNPDFVGCYPALLLDRLISCDADRA